MEQQAFYIVFAIVAIVIVVGIVFWAVTYSSRNDYDDFYRNRGGYPPPYYPPHYPQHYPPHYPQQESPILSILSLGLVVFLLFALMQYCSKTEELDRLERIHQGDSNIVNKEDPSLSQNEIYEGDAVYGEMEHNLPESYNTTQEAVIQPVPESVPLTESFFFQKFASNDSEQILQDAQNLEATFPNRVYIGEKADDGTGYPFKLLIGPYATEEQAKSVHGRGTTVYRPVDKGIQIYNPR